MQEPDLLSLAREESKDPAFADLPISAFRAPVSRGTESLQTRRWREMDSNLYGAFGVKRLFVFFRFFVRSWKPFFVPSPAIRFAERAEGVKGPKR